MLNWCVSSCYDAVGPIASAPWKMQEVDGRIGGVLVRRLL